MVLRALRTDGTWPMTAALDAGGQLINNVLSPLAATDAATRGYVDANAPGSDQQVDEALGSVILAQAFSVLLITTSNNLSDGAATYVPVYLAEGTTVTGVKWYQSVKGNYTADNNNKVALYSYSAGTMTKVAECADDGTLWQTATSNTVGSKAFTTPYVAPAGLYIIAMLYNASAIVTGPGLGMKILLSNAGVATLDYTNSAKRLAFRTAQTDLPASETMAALTASTIGYWVAVY